MPSEEQLKLADEVKGVHLKLRARAQEVGAEIAWKEHLEQKDVLLNYSKAMKKLAEEFWAKSNKDGRQNLCRLRWITQTIQSYYLEGVLEKHLLKERRRLSLHDDAHQLQDWSLPLKLLDVGSCYNPFKQFDIFDTFAIDLCPASEDVKTCNFLEVEVVDEFEGWNQDVISKLPKNYFDVVVFCLFLEYLPSPEQRLKACSLAWDVLKLGGILTIVTPDSAHETFHASLMKTWKLVLARLGFVRFKIEKLKYLYCMALRKTNFKNEYSLLPEYKFDGKLSIEVPQDKVDYESKHKYIF